LVVDIYQNKPYEEKLQKGYPIWGLETKNGYIREQEINNVPKFCTAIFSLLGLLDAIASKAKNADIPKGMASIFNEK
jgi:hypothetical protein